MNITYPSTYYNRSSNPSFSDYKKLIFKAGKVLQSAEVNEIQDTLLDHTNRLASRFIRNGDLISDGLVVINANTIDCSESIVYVDKYYVDIPTKSITYLNNANNDTLGVVIRANIITSVDNTLLLDPAIEAINYREDGADRLEITGEWMLESAYVANPNYDFLPIYEIEDRRLKYSKGDATDIKRMKDLLAKYDRNSNGNYVINGYSVSFKNRTVYDGPFIFTLGEGSANVNGYNFETFATSDISLDSLLDLEAVNSEPVTFTSNTNYTMRNTPIKNVYRISGVKQINNENVIHGASTGAIDDLVKNPVLSVLEVKQGGTTFVEGTDYTLSGDRVSWALSGNEPAPGSTYTVTYRYQYTEDKDSGFTGTNGNINVTTDLTNRTKISINDFVTGTTVNIDYDFILDRIDTIYLDSDGSFGVAKGKPSQYNPKPPKIPVNGTKLALAEIHLTANLLTPEITNVAQRVFKMSDIQSILNVVRHNEYNIARLSLYDNLAKQERSSLSKGMFVDPFHDDDMRDMGYTQSALTVGGNLIMNIDWTNFDISPTKTRDIVTNTLPVASTFLALRQPYYSKSRKITEMYYASAPNAILTLSPNRFSWIDQDIYRDFVTSAQASNVAVNQLVQSTRIFGSGNAQLSSVSSSNVSSTVRESLGTTSSTSSSISISEKPAIVPEGTLFNLASNTQAFNNNEQVDVYFDDKLYTTTSADGNGKVNLNVTVPVGTISGLKNVKLVGRDSEVLGTSLFEATPLTRTNTTTFVQNWRWVTTTVTTQTTSISRFWEWSSDPVAQTFTLDANTMLDSITFYLTALPLSELTLYVVETTAGIPDITKLMGYELVQPSSLVIGANRITFSNKLLLSAETEYAFIVKAMDKNGELRVARLGERDINQGKWLTSQSYSTGVLLISSNNKTWTPIQEEDLQFEIYGCKFSSDRTMILPIKSVNNATDIMILANSEESVNTSVYFKIELMDRSSNNVFDKVDPHFQIRLGDRYSGRVKVTAYLHTNNNNYTPSLDNNIQLSVGSSSTFSDYMSRSFIIPDSTQRLSIYLDTYNPIDTNIRVFYMTNNTSKTWAEVPKVPADTVTLINDWTEQHYLITSPTVPSEETTKIKIEMSTTNDNNRPVIANMRVNLTDI